MARRHVLERAQLVPVSRAEAFAFFSDPRNLEAITPGFLRFRITSGADAPLAAGARLEYRLSLFGVPLRWTTLIEAWEPGVRFVDVQLGGPYRFWRHAHAFVDAPGGTRVEDRVQYELPLGVLGAAAHAIFVRRALARIFDHREERIAALLGAGGARGTPG